MCLKYYYNVTSLMLFCVLIHDFINLFDFQELEKVKKQLEFLNQDCKSVGVGVST